MGLPGPGKIIGGAGAAAAVVVAFRCFGSAIGRSAGKGKIAGTHHALQVFRTAFVAFHFDFLITGAKQDFFSGAAVRALEFIYRH